MARELKADRLVPVRVVGKKSKYNHMVRKSNLLGYADMRPYIQMEWFDQPARKWRPILSTA
jgi:hypothetical protein